MADTVENILVDYKKIMADVLEIRKTASEKIKESMHGMFKDFFDKNPEYLYVTWSQYTPYFNDGETCEFSVHDKWIVSRKNLMESDEWSGVQDNDGNPEDYLTGWDAEEVSDSFSDWRDKSGASIIAEFKEKYGDAGLRMYENGKNLLEILDDIPEEIYLDAFGDHAIVIVDRNGITVEEYDHD